MAAHQGSARTTSPPGGVPHGRAPLASPPPPWPRPSGGVSAPITAAFPGSAPITSPRAITSTLTTSPSRGLYPRHSRPSGGLLLWPCSPGAVPSMASLPRGLPVAWSSPGRSPIHLGAGVGRSWTPRGPAVQQGLNLGTAWGSCGEAAAGQEVGREPPPPSGRPGQVPLPGDSIVGPLSPVLDLN